VCMTSDAGTEKRRRVWGARDTVGGGQACPHLRRGAGGESGRWGGEGVCA
jgi:hypothetical protein